LVFSSGRSWFKQPFYAFKRFKVWFETKTLGPKPLQSSKFFKYKRKKKFNKNRETVDKSSSKIEQLNNMTTKSEYDCSFLSIEEPKRHSDDDTTQPNSNIVVSSSSQISCQGFLIEEISKTSSLNFIPFDNNSNHINMMKSDDQSLSSSIAMIQYDQKQDSSYSMLNSLNNAIIESSSLNEEEQEEEFSMSDNEESQTSSKLNYDSSKCLDSGFCSIKDSHDHEQQQRHKGNDTGDDTSHNEEVYELRQQEYHKKESEEEIIELENTENSEYSDSEAQEEHEMLKDCSLLDQNEEKEDFSEEKIHQNESEQEKIVLKNNENSEESEKDAREEHEIDVECSLIDQNESKEEKNELKTVQKIEKKDVSGHENGQNEEKEDSNVQEPQENHQNEPVYERIEILPVQGIEISQKSHEESQNKLREEVLLDVHATQSLENSEESEQGDDSLIDLIQECVNLSNEIEVKNVHNEFEFIKKVEENVQEELNGFKVADKEQNELIMVTNEPDMPEEKNTQEEMSVEER
jgi:hypothetical protein